tara:strand:+ start:220 stop:585 length:366 start_codon:yes stop_codon:yes gene_type:complete
MKHLFIVLTSIFIISCATNVEEDLSVDICVPADASFSKDIHPILISSCVKCHGGTNPQNGLNYESYEGTLISVSAGKPENSSLYGTVSHTFGSEMPYLEGKIPDCEIEKIKNWILNGAKND